MWMDMRSVDGEEKEQWGQSQVHVNAIIIPCCSTPTHHHAFITIHRCDAIAISNRYHELIGMICLRFTNLRHCLLHSSHHHTHDALSMCWPWLNSRWMTNEMISSTLILLHSLLWWTNHAICCSSHNHCIISSHLFHAGFIMPCFHIDSMYAQMALRRCCGIISSMLPSPPFVISSSRTSKHFSISRINGFNCCSAIEAKEDCLSAVNASVAMSNHQMMRCRTSRSIRLVNRYRSNDISSKSLPASCDSDEMMHFGYHQCLVRWAVLAIVNNQFLMESMWSCCTAAEEQSINHNASFHHQSYIERCQVCQLTYLTWQTLQIVASNLKWSEHFIISNINHAHIEQSEIGEIANWWWQHCQSIRCNLSTTMNGSDCEWNESDGEPPISAD